MRKCLDCRAQLDDIEMKCSECGSKNLSAIESDEPEKKPISRKKIVAISLWAVVAIIIISIIIGGAFVVIRNTQTEPVTKGIEAMISGDLDGYINEFYPAFQDAMNAVFQQSISSEDYQSEQKNGLEETYGSNYRIYVNAIDVKDCSSGTIASLNSDYEQTEVVFQDAKYVTVSIFITGSTGENYSSRSVYSVKIDGNWYMFEDFEVSTDE